MGVYLLLLPTLISSLVGTSRAKWGALEGSEIGALDVADGAETANVAGTNHKTAEQFLNVKEAWLKTTEENENINKKVEETIKEIYDKAKDVVSDSNLEITTVKDDNQDRIQTSTKYDEDGDSVVDSSESDSDPDSDSDSDSTTNDRTIHLTALTLAVLISLFLTTLLIYRSAKKCQNMCNRYHDVPRRKIVTVTTLTPVQTGPNSDRVNLIGVRQTRILHV